MLKGKVADLAARLLRAAIVRIVNTHDLELTRTIQAVSSSASLVDLSMYNAKPCSSKLEVMETAFETMDAKMGCVCELGVYKGYSLNLLARHFAPAKVYGFDSFTGLPEFWRDDFPEGAFDVSGEKLNFEPNCILYKGLFDDTLPKFLQDVQESIGFLHVDCDLYSSTASVFRNLVSRIHPGTVIVFDEYFNYPAWQNHEYKAFREFLDATGYECKYIAYNKFGEQVAVVIEANQNSNRGH
jgi:predicted O-methyltransferase YrrM